MKKSNLTPDSIRQILNHSLAQLDKDTADALHASRNQALARHRALQHAPVQAWLSHHGLWIGSPTSHHKHVYWALALLLAGFLFTGIAYVQHDRDHNNDVDIEMLTDDVPVDAYVD